MIYLPFTIYNIFNTLSSFFPLNIQTRSGCLKSEMNGLGWHGMEWNG